MVRASGARGAAACIIIILGEVRFGAAARSSGQQAAAAARLLLSRSSIPRKAKEYNDGGIIIEKNCVAYLAPREGNAVAKKNGSGTASSPPG